MNNTTDDFHASVITIPFAYHVIYIIFSAFTFLVMFSGNLIVVITLTNNRKLLHPMNIYITSISISGIVCAVLLPTGVGYFPSPVFPINLSCHARKIQGILFLTSTVNSVLCMLVIATERYQVIVQQKSSPVEDKHRFVIIAAIWLSAFIYNAPLYFGNMDQGHVSLLRTDSNSTNNNILFCIPTGPIIQIHFTVSILTTYVLPILLMAFLYQKTINKVVKQVKKFNDNFNLQHKAKLRAVKAMISIVVIFAFCWLPGHCLQMLSAWRRSGKENQRFTFLFIVLHDVALQSAFAHHWIHTIVYPVQCHQFRKKAKEILTILKVWKKKK